MPITTLHFDESDGKITVKDFVEIINFFDKNLLVGAELERVVPQDTDSLARTLNTKTKSFDSGSELINYKTARVRNKYNVAFLTRDATFEYHNEIIFGGNAESFQWNYEKLKEIEDKLTELGAIPFSPKTSTHISVLTSHDCLLHSNVLKNIFNITRAFSGALYWLGSGCKTDIVRSNARQFAKPILQYTPNDRQISELGRMIGKYNQLNLSKQAIDNSILHGLFVEFRGVDGVRVPSVISANMMLYKALIYKAVELSVQGVVQVENLSSDWRKNKITVNKLVLRDGDLSEEEIGFFIQESHRLIQFLSSYLKKFDKNLVSILEQIADRPASVRMREGKRVTTIDRELYIKEKSLNAKEQELLDIIITTKVEADDIKQWKSVVAEKLGCSVRWIEKMLIAITDITKLNLVFDCEQKSVRID